MFYYTQGGHLVARGCTRNVPMQGLLDSAAKWVTTSFGTCDKELTRERVLIGITLRIIIGAIAVSDWSQR
jgi:hypothetical protein